MTTQETREDPVHLDYPLGDPRFTSVDLNRFEQLDDGDRRRIIIRVLCGLVALPEEDVPPPLVPAEPPRRRWRPSLPFLGLEIGGAHKLDPATSSDRRAVALPYLGHEQPF